MEESIKTLKDLMILKPKKKRATIPLLKVSLIKWVIVKRLDKNVLEMKLAKK